jgi:hypothetical protein
LRLSKVCPTNVSSAIADRFKPCDAALNARREGKSETRRKCSLPTG